MQCPYYHRLSLDQYHHGVRGYCEADALQRLRAPTLFEETHCCMTEQFSACPLFQACHDHSETAENPASIPDDRS
ncbi:MAG: hypothetical protein HYZ81_23810 [Nitrospinae bacterium]|nr:hypothetical protein [Nitrospinota bacterium]